jgi:CRP-like cAMP-binding protein
MPRGAAINRIVHRLPADEAVVVEPCLEDVRLVAGDVLCEAGAPIAYAVFPVTGIISLFGRNPEGSVLELGVVGRDGMFGTPLILGLPVSPLLATVQGEGRALRIEAVRFRRIVAICPTMRFRAHRYAHRLTDEIALTAVCSCFHSVESRSARWMLSISDRMDSDVFALTQALLAVTLGVLRPAISRAASALASQGLVTYSRGRVRIVDRVGLEAVACSCYPLFAAQYRRAPK